MDSVVDGSAAQFGGIYPGDVIVSINDKDVKDFDDLKDYLKFSKVGDELNVLVSRDGEMKNIRVRLRKGL